MSKEDKTLSDNEVLEYLNQKGKAAQEKKDRAVDRKAILQTAQNVLLVEQLDKTFKKVFCRGWACPPRYRGKKDRSLKRIVNILLSDLHIGANLSSKECPTAYGSVQESRRLGRIALQVADYKHQYRSQSRLVVHLLGDIINGIIHGDSSESLSKQFSAATHYLTQMIMFWASQYPSVEVHCTPGNHGRNPLKHLKGAVHQKWDSFETMVYFAVKTAVLNAGIKNCTFNIPETPYYVANLFDAKLFGTHGDTVLRPGVPEKSINVGALTKQIYRWNTTPGVGGPFQVFVCGHIHTGSTVSLPNNVTMITNGSVIPPSPFAVSVGMASATCGQYIWESTPQHAIGDQRFIIVDGAEKNPSNNTIVTPFKGF